MDTDEPVKVRVIFDWRNDPDAAPSAMALYLYPRDGGQPLRYIFSGRDGGEIHLPFGVYDAVCINADNTDWAALREMDNASSASVFTTEPSDLSLYGSLSDLLARRRESDEFSTLVVSPEGTWTAGSEGFDARYDGTDKTLVMYPVDDLCHYTVDIYDVEGLDAYTEDVTIPGALSNMSEGISIFSSSPLTNKGAIPFILEKGDTPGSLHSEFLTFGENTQDAPQHHLCLYTKTADGSWAVQTKDVTEQVHGAPDRRNVHIVIHGATVNHPEAPGAGFIVDVNGWEAEYFEWKM